jgi:hypothetical protein
MKLKTNSIFINALLMIIFCANSLFAIEPGDYSKVVSSLALMQSKNLSQLKESMSSSTAPMVVSRGELTEAELQNNEFDIKVCDSKRRERAIKAIANKEYALNKKIKRVKFINNLHEFFALRNDAPELAENLAKHFKVTINGIEIPYAQERIVPVLGNSYVFTLSIPHGKLKKITSLGAALLKESIGFIKGLCVKLLNPLHYIFRYSCKLEEDIEIQDQDDHTQYISNVYAKQLVFRDNFNPLTLWYESRKIKYEWSNLCFELPEIKY